MDILLLSKKFPWPLKDGEVIAIHNNIKAFSQAGHRVTVLAMNTLKHHTDVDSLPESASGLARYISVDIDTGVKPLPALSNLVLGGSYHIERFISKNFRNKLQQLLQTESFDLIQCEGLYFGPYLEQIRGLTRAPVTMRAHNVEAEIWQRVADETPGFLKKNYLKVQAGRMFRYEQRQYNRYDAIIPITERDASQIKSLGASKPVFTSPAGIDLERYNDYLNKDYQPLSVGFIGSLDWLPNVEGLRWLVHEVWPEVSRQLPAARLYIAGRNMPLPLKLWNSPTVSVIGEVDNSLAFMSDKQLMVVPLFSGSGMRIKIIEGMALGKALLSTSIGAEGINYTVGKNLFIAGDRAAFTKQMIQLLSHAKTCQNAGKNARSFIEEQYDNNKLGERLLAFYKQQFNL